MLLVLLGIMMLLVLVVLLMTCALVLAMFGGLMTKVPFVAAPRGVAEGLATLCPLTASSVFYDLGCGHGGIVAAMAGRYPAARSIGVEIAPLPIILLWLRARFMPLPAMEFQYKNFNDVDLSNATHIYLYLFPALMDRLLPKLEKEVRPGTRIVSCDFTFKDRTPTVVVPLSPSSHPHRLYVYDF